MITALVVGNVFSLIVYRQRQTHAVAMRYDELASSAVCTKLRTTPDAGRTHLNPGQGVKYETSPPTSGPHNPVPLAAGVRTTPLSDDPSAQSETIYQAVHSLEHGYVIVWYRGLSQHQVDQIDTAVGSERKVIVVPYPKLRGGSVALTAWTRVQVCQRADTKLIEAFVERFREKTGPEKAAQ